MTVVGLLHVQHVVVFLFLPTPLLIKHSDIIRGQDMSRCDDLIHLS
jgi:hypothetical protein